MSVEAVVNLKNIVSNAEKIRKTLPSGVKFCAVVKADAYGHGAERVANAIYNVVDCFAVATVEEGVKLRFSGVDKDVLVLTKTFDDELPLAVCHNLILTAGAVCDLKRYAREGKRQGVKVKTHIKFDTGMRRQGISTLTELKRAFAFCKNNENVCACGLYSHFARPENDRSRKAAVKKFCAAKEIVKAYGDIVCHISASGGFIKGEYFDMVRIGILLYGYTPFKTDGIKVKPAMRIFAPVVARRKLKRGDHALYGEKRAESDTEITLVRYGYADGLLRSEIRGQFNNRCMDITALTGVKERVRRVAVMTDADETARKYKTVSYEVLVKCALRAEKKYIT